MMAHANLFIFYWGDALLTVVYICNHVHSKFISSTLYELWNNIKPNLGYFHSWMCATYIHNNSHKYKNLVLKEKKMSLYKIFKHSKRLYHMMLYS